MLQLGSNKTDTPVGPYPTWVENVENGDKVIPVVQALWAGR